MLTKGRLSYRKSQLSPILVGFLTLSALAGGACQVRAASQVTSAPSTTYTFTRTNNKVEWMAIGSPGFLRINGTGGVAEGSLVETAGKVSGTLVVDLSAYTTDIESRDKHMHEKYLQSTKYRHAKLVLNAVPVTRGNEFPWQGQLTIKNITKPVEGEANFDGNKLEASFKIDISEYSIEVPKYLGITVAEEVEVTLEGTF